MEVRHCVRLAWVVDALSSLPHAHNFPRKSGRTKMDKLSKRLHRHTQRTMQNKGECHKQLGKKMSAANCCINVSECTKPMNHQLPDESWFEMNATDNAPKTLLRDENAVWSIKIRTSVQQFFLGLHQVCARTASMGMKSCMHRHRYPLATTPAISLEEPLITIHVKSWCGSNNLMSDPRPSLHRHRYPHSLQ